MPFGDVLPDVPVKQPCSLDLQPCSSLPASDTSVHVALDGRQHEDYDVTSEQSIAPQSPLHHFEMVRALDALPFDASIDCDTDDSASHVTVDDCILHVACSASCSDNSSSLADPYWLS